VARAPDYGVSAGLATIAGALGVVVWRRLGPVAGILLLVGVFGFFAPRLLVTGALALPVRVRARDRSGGRDRPRTPLPVSLDSVATPYDATVRVLVVEDEAKMATLVRKALELEGYSVDVAMTGTDAVWMGTENEYDAIVLDVMIPEPDGFEVCRRLRADGRWAPILLLTARDSVDDRVIGLDAGADDYIPKPFSFAELYARLRALTRRGHRSVRESSRSLTSSSTRLASCYLPARRSTEPQGVRTCSTCSCGTPTRCSAAPRSSARLGLRVDGRPTSSTLRPVPARRSTAIRPHDARNRPRAATGSGQTVRLRLERCAAGYARVRAVTASRACLSGSSSTSNIATRP
jgi:CheY-like chemotaxis protein